MRLKRLLKLGKFLLGLNDIEEKKGGEEGKKDL